MYRGDWGLGEAYQYHIRARALLPRVRNAAQVWVTEAVLIEVGNALSAFNRTAAIQFIQHK